MLNDYSLKKLNKTADEMRDLVKRSKRKLLEFEVAVSLGEIREGKGEIIADVNKFFKRP